MIAIADASDTPLWPWQVWAGIALVVIMVAAFSWLLRYDNPVMGEDTSRLDRLDGADRPLPPRCWSTGPRGGHAYKVEGGTWTCMRCGDVREAA